MEDTLKLRKVSELSETARNSWSGDGMEIVEISEVITADLSRIGVKGKLMVRRPLDGAEYIIGDKNRVTVGRSPSCDIVVSDVAVSRVHGHFTSTNKGYVFIDTSSNGTYVQIGGNTIRLSSKGILLNRSGCLYVGVDPCSGTVDEKFVLMFVVQ